MRRADRLFEIVQLMRGGRLVTARQLGARLEVSERTIYRDIADLMASGVPISGEAGYGYVLEDGYDLPPLMFTRGELAALIAGARLLAAWGGREMARGAEEAVAKIDAVIDEGLRREARQVAIHSYGAEMTEAARRILDQVEAAIANSQTLSFAYSNESGARSQRSIRPLSLYFWGRVWTCVSWCELREDFRTFRIDRMEEVKTGDRFKPQPGQGLRDFLARPDPKAKKVLGR